VNSTLKTIALWVLLVAGALVIWQMINKNNSVGCQFDDGPQQAPEGVFRPGIHSDSGDYL